MAGIVLWVQPPKPLAAAKEGRCGAEELTVHQLSVKVDQEEFV